LYIPFINPNFYFRLRVARKFQRESSRGRYYAFDPIDYSQYLTLRTACENPDLVTV